MHHARASKSQWQSRRNMSLGPPVRRAHPASGATWNVQVVRGKMTSRCLWHACRALILGMVLMFLGAGMATIGYYAEHLSVGQEIRGNATVRVKNESRGFHLNNLSYVGPIVMGFGGFIVVAACVMTFEARDSAAKVVPARFKVSTTSRTPRTNSSSRRTTGTSTQTGPTTVNRGENHMGVFRTLPATTAAAAAALANECGTDRKALTAALVHFSRALGKPRSPKLETPPKSPSGRRVSRSGSVPNLVTQLAVQRTADASGGATSTIQNQSTMTSTPPATARYIKSSGRHRCHRKSSMMQRSSLSAEKTATSSPLFLHPTAGSRPHHWHHRHAMSVDEAGPHYRAAHSSGDGMTAPTESAGGGGGGSRLRDRNQRSDTARRHVLSRQKPIEKDEPHAGRGGSSKPSQKNMPSAELTNVFRSARSRTASLASRTPSLDSRAVQTDSPIGDPPFGRSESARRLTHREWSTPSEEREYRSDFSIKSEPGGAARSMSGGQSTSLEPCVPEESGNEELPENGIVVTTPPTATTITKPIQIEPIDSVAPHRRKSPAEPHVTSAKRPDSLILKCSTGASPGTAIPPSSTANTDAVQTSADSVAAAAAVVVERHDKHKYLYRSNSSRLYNRPKPKVQLTKEFDQIYFIGSNKEDEFYDSIDVIDERRSSNFKRSASSSGTSAATAAAALCRSSTVIYSEYCSGSAMVESADATATAAEASEVAGECSRAVDVAERQVKARAESMDRINVVNDAAVSVEPQQMSSPRPPVSETTTTATTATPTAPRAPSKCSVDEIEVMKDDDHDDDEGACRAAATTSHTSIDVTGDATIIGGGRRHRVEVPGIVNNSAAAKMTASFAGAEADSSDNDSDSGRALMMAHVNEGGGGGVRRSADLEGERRTPLTTAAEAAEAAATTTTTSTTTPTTITVRAEIEDCGGMSE